MTRILAIADETAGWLDTGSVRGAGVDLVLAAGDLPFDYLERLADLVNCPCVLVPGNHDPDLSGYSTVRGLSLFGGFPKTWPGPAGWVNADTEVVSAAGLRIAGLGGSLEYSGGPNQWPERAQARRVRTLVRRARRRPVDVLLTHSPPLGVGDREDPPHRGFACLHEAVRKLRPKLLLHGHIHPYGELRPDHELAGTRVCNVVGYRILTSTELTHAS
jgi:hypothetical protein